MKKYLFSKYIVFFSFFVLLLISISLVLQFQTTTVSKAQAQSYSSINCPTPTEKSSLQLIPCTGKSAITNTPGTQTPQQNPTNKPIQSPTSSQTPVTTQRPPANQPTTTLKFPTPAVKPAGPVCTPDTVKNPKITCSCPANEERDTICTVPDDAHCTNNGGYPYYTGSGTAKPPSGPDKCFWLWTAQINKSAAKATNCTMECNSKPVLYFYSPTTLSINVILDIPGFVTASIPTYPANGWQNVTVHPNGTPDGTLLYDNKAYNELYYEDETIKAEAPTQGFIIKTADLASSLRTYTTKLGLNTSEQDEFITYWVPRLKGLNSPYIFFSVFDQVQKEKVDHVIVTPKPQTTIAFLAYFKPLSQPVTVAPLQFPAVPRRVGFTMVEWGGTIDGAK